MLLTKDYLISYFDKFFLIKFDINTYTMLLWYKHVSFKNDTAHEYEKKDQWHMTNYNRQGKRRSRWTTCVDHN